MKGDPGKYAKRWKAGKEMPMFSGRTWGELEDIFPRNMKLASDAYKIITVLAPAWVKTKEFIKINYGETIRWDDFTYLCWMQRVEDAKENVAFEAFSARMGLNCNNTLWWIKKSRLTKLGLVENLPIRAQFLYRITEKGKMIVKKFTEELEQAHKNLDMWQSWKSPERALNKVTPKLRDFFDIEIPPPTE